MKFNLTGCTDRDLRNIAAALENYSEWLELHGDEIIVLKRRVLELEARLAHPQVIEDSKKV